MKNGIAVALAFSLRCYRQRVVLMSSWVCYWSCMSGVEGELHSNRPDEIQVPIPKKGDQQLC